MNIIKAKDYDQLSRIGANIIAGLISQKPNALLGLATGSSPVGIYKELVAKYQAGELDFSQVSSVNLDEYVGLDPTAPQSYLQFMKDNLFDHVNMKNYQLPNGLATDLEGECVRYNQVMADLGGIDLQLLGIGHNGHIGFNEPSDSFTKGTNLVDLNDTTIDANTRFFSSRDEVPRQALSMGIGDIMKAKAVLLVVSGADKRDILKAATTGPITPAVPASILQYHPNCTIIADTAAYGE